MALREGGLPAGGTETIQPRPGLLFLFPSRLYHQVRAYRGMRARFASPSTSASDTGCGWRNGAARWKNSSHHHTGSVQERQGDAGHLRDRRRRDHGPQG